MTLHRSTKTLVAALGSLILTLQANAAQIAFDLQGTAGVGLLPGSEPGSITGGTGGETGVGITFDDVTNLLDLRSVGWGSSQGFTDLTSLANNSHLHGPTSNNNGNGFTETAGVAFNLVRTSDATTGGSFNDPANIVLLSGAQEIDLLNGKFYINIHTVNNGGGEMRGFLVPVPEPTAAMLGLFGAASLLSLRRRR